MYIFSELLVNALALSLHWILVFLLIDEISLHVLAHCNVGCNYCNVGLSLLLSLALMNCFVLM